MLAGESAGGNLVAVTLIALRDAGAPLPACGVLISPWVDLAGTHPSRQANEPYDYGPPEMLLAQARAFAGGVALDDPRISPVHAELTGLPPLFVQVGEVELLAGETRALADRARAAGSTGTGASADGASITTDAVARSPDALAPHDVHRRL